MKLREALQAGVGRPLATGILSIAAAALAWYWWPPAGGAERVLSGLQKTAFVAGAFAVTAYNLRTRVVDFALKVEGSPARVDDFCMIARSCGKRLTNLVVLFTVTAAWLGGLGILPPDTCAARLAGVGGVGVFAASMVSFFYIIFAFERLERFALDEAEKGARKKEAQRLFPKE